MNKSFLLLLLIIGCSSLKHIPEDFLSFTKNAIDSTEHYRDILQNSKFEKSTYSISDKGIKSDSILITNLKKWCSDEFVLDYGRTYESLVHHIPYSSDIDTIYQIVYFCKNKKYNEKKYRSWQSNEPEEFLICAIWTKKKGIWEFSTFTNNP